MTTELIRKCLACGKTIFVKLHSDGTYEGGHYFGIIEVPKSEVKEEYRNHPNYRGEDSENVYFEFWECQDCFSN